jgi:predicted unusual protein kinase regulating ubiquinone biosynthesis (AarF/ABC1/UbiB family)
MENKTEKFLNQEGANQLIGLIFAKIAADIEAGVTDDIEGAQDDAKAAGAKAVKDFIAKTVGEIEGAQAKFQPLTAAEISQIWQTALEAGSPDGGGI